VPAGYRLRPVAGLVNRAQTILHAGETGRAQSTGDCLPEKTGAALSVGLRFSERGWALGWADRT